jgi:hypothetical protein
MVVGAVGVEGLLAVGLEFRNGVGLVDEVQLQGHKA